VAGGAAGGAAAGGSAGGSAGAAGASVNSDSPRSIASSPSPATKMNASLIASSPRLVVTMNCHSGALDTTMHAPRSRSCSTIPSGSASGSTSAVARCAGSALGVNVTR
jgi:hypothetical protein